MNPDEPSHKPNDTDTTTRPAESPIVESVSSHPSDHHQGAIPAVTDPGRTMGIVAMILSIVGVYLIGLILGIVSLNKSKKAGHKNGFALAAIIIGAIGSVLAIVGAILFTLFAANAAQEYQRQCAAGDTFSLYGETSNCED